MAFTYRDLAYTSPQTEERMSFSYDGAIEDGITHNLGEFQFAGVDEKYFQDRSLSSDSYNFNIYITDQTDLKKARRLFNEKATLGKPGYLEHPDPAIGTVPVVVSSYKVTQNALKKTGAAKIAVVFLKTIPNLIGGDPSESSNPASASATQQAIDDINEEQAEEFASAVDDSTGKATASLVTRITAAIESANSKLKSVAQQLDSVNVLFTTAYSNLLSEVDDLVSTPYDLARQVQNLIQLPMVAIDSAQDRISAYQDFIDDILTFSENDLKEIVAGSVAGKNLLLGAGISAMAAVSAINYAATSTTSISLDEIISGEDVDSGYLSRSQIIQTINSIQDIAKTATETLSEKSADFGDTLFFKQYFDYSVLNKDLVTATVKNLNNRIFNLAKEVTIETEREISPIVLAADLYGSVEINTVKFLVESNDLHGSEIYLIPKGRDIVYYT